jgi:hypothetical protein
LQYCWVSASSTVLPVKNLPTPVNPVCRHRAELSLLRLHIAHYGSAGILTGSSIRYVLVRATVSSPSGFSRCLRHQLRQQSGLEVTPCGAPNPHICPGDRPCKHVTNGSTFTAGAGILIFIGRFQTVD